MSATRPGPLVAAAVTRPEAAGAGWWPIWHPDALASVLEPKRAAVALKVITATADATAGIQAESSLLVSRYCGLKMERRPWRRWFVPRWSHASRGRPHREGRRDDNADVALR